MNLNDIKTLNTARVYRGDVLRIFRSSGVLDTVYLQCNGRPNLKIFIYDAEVVLEDTQPIATMLINKPSTLKLNLYMEEGCYFRFEGENQGESDLLVTCLFDKSGDFKRRKDKPKERDE
jgi:hypothetical protein